MSYWINIKVENSIVSMLASSWLICYWLLDVCGTKCFSFLHFRILLPIFFSLKLSQKFRISVWNLIFDEHGMDSIRLSRLTMYRRSCVRELNKMNWIRTIGETVNIKKNNSCIKIDGDKSIGLFHGFQKHEKKIARLEKIMYTAINTDFLFYANYRRETDCISFNLRINALPTPVIKALMADL